ncbi:Uncharacterised protein [Vibrio cholerae]|nr:Uncharacterised protein [Vibrio cholerae]
MQIRYEHAPSGKSALHHCRRIPISQAQKTHAAVTELAAV